jgi:hypothetical protein
VTGVRQQCRGIAEKAEDRFDDHEGDVECRSEGEGDTKRFRCMLVQAGGSMELAARRVPMQCHALMPSRRLAEIVEPLPGPLYYVVSARLT